MSVLDKVYKIIYGSVYWPRPATIATSEKELPVPYVTPDFLLMNELTMRSIMREDYQGVYVQVRDRSVRPTVLGVQVLFDDYMPEGEVLGLVKTTRA